MSAAKLQTSSLGFTLTVEIFFDEPESTELLGQHVTLMTPSGDVPANAPHEVHVVQGLELVEVVGAITHEVYHLFYSVRNKITVDEETETQVFSQLVENILNLYIESEDEPQ